MFFERGPWQECAVEREASWGRAKLRVDWGRAIDVGEVATGGGQRLLKELEHVISGMSCIFST